MLVWLLCSLQVLVSCLVLLASPESEVSEAWCLALGVSLELQVSQGLQVNVLD